MGSEEKTEWADASLELASAALEYFDGKPPSEERDRLLDAILTLSNMGVMAIDDLRSDVIRDVNFVEVVEGEHD